MVDRAATLPLRGLRVLDLADEIGELCGRLLADLGAEVVRVEPPGGADSRSLPPLSPSGIGLGFAYRNCNKGSITLDLEDPRAVAELQRLASAADVFIESSKPGHLAGLGVDPRQLVEANPRLIVASITAFGQDGPYADYEATNDTIMALSGHIAASGLATKPPLQMPGTLASDAAGAHACFAVLCALLARQSTGRGQYLDVAALAATAQLTPWGAANASHQTYAGNSFTTLRSGDSPMYPHVATADGFIRLVVLSPTQWQALWEWMGEPEAFADPSWSEIITRFLNLDVLNLAYAAHFSSMTKLEAAAEAQRRGVVATPMLTPTDVLANEHYRTRGTFTEVTLEDGTIATAPSGFFELDGQRIGIRLGPPRVGADDDAVDWAPRPAGAGDDANRKPSPSKPHETPSETSPASLPLAGLRVLDFGHGGVGVEVGRLLAEYGAEVIKVETRTYPDFIRVVLGSEMTASFASSSRSKRSLGINYRTDEGLALIHRLAASSDVVIENNSTGTMDDLGIGYDALRAINDGLIMASSQLMGAHGPYADWIGYGPTLQTVGGLSYLWNFDDGDPPPGSTAIHPDHFAGRIVAISTLAALFARSVTGAGGHTSVAQVEALICTLGDQLMAESLAPGSVQPTGNDNPRSAPSAVFPCSGDDDWCAITVRDDDDWARLVVVLGEPGWATDESLSTSTGRCAARSTIQAELSAWTAERRGREVMELCQAAGVPAGLVVNVVEQLTDPHFVETGFIVDIDQPDLGPMAMDGPAFRASAMPPPAIHAAPRLGEHTGDIARELLGLGDEEIDGLIAAGVLEVARDA